jgi:hypothetical protein
MLLRALGEAAVKAGSRFIEFGVRSLALATGTHETTVARQLRALAAAERPLIRLAGEARGTRGDLYELVIPQPWRDAAETRAWRAGKIHALRPVFRELGIVAAFVYETIETAAEPLHSAAVARVSGLSPTAVTEALALMAAWHMIERSEGRWRIAAGTSLRALAEHFGVLQDMAAQLSRYRAERALWQQWLAKRALAGEPILAAVDEDYPFWLGQGPPEDEQTMASILQPQWAS